MTARVQFSIARIATPVGWARVLELIFVIACVAMHVFLSTITSTDAYHKSYKAHARYATKVYFNQRNRCEVSSAAMLCICRVSLITVADKDILVLFA